MFMCSVEPPVLEGVVASESRASFPVRLHAQRDVKPGVHIAAFDMALDGQRYGQWFDFVVQVVNPSAGAQDRAKPAVWMGPPSYDNGKCFRELLEKPGAWQQTRSEFDVLMYTDHWLHKQFVDSAGGSSHPN